MFFFIFLRLWLWLNGKALQRHKGRGLTHQALQPCNQSQAASPHRWRSRPTQLGRSSRLSPSCWIYNVWIQSVTKSLPYGKNKKRYSCFIYNFFFTTKWDSYCKIYFLANWAGILKPPAYFSSPRTLILLSLIRLNALAI